MTLLSGDACGHLEVTGCRLYLDNWNDRVHGGWVKRREQGTNLNVRGGNRSVLIEGNTFIKHGNDEALSFFATLPAGATEVVHGNVRVVGNTFTYLDSGTTADGGTETAGARPMHVNDVLVSFNPGGDVLGRDVRTVWRDVLFAENTLDLEGPVKSAVSVNVLPGDVCHNVSFERNRIFHKYIDTHQLPGNGVLDGIGENENGASPYLYSNTFAFETIKDRSNLAPGTKGAASGTGTEIKPTPVVYRGNYIRYTQKTYDQPDRTNLSSRLAYEHSCFAVHGGDIEILGNRIDGTGAVVVRHSPDDGVYGNPDNPVTLFHCFPCEVTGNYSVRISGNEATGYGLTLSSRPQYWGYNSVVKGYCVQMENNTFSEGAAMVLYNVKDSDIAVVRNSFTGCSKETFIQAVYKVELQSDPSVKLSLFQNKIAPGFGSGSYCDIIAAEVPKGSPVLTPISEFCFMLNYLPGYAGMSMPEKNTAAQSHISDNLFESNPSNVCGS